MVFDIKKLTDSERDICFKTISSRAVFAIVGDAIKTEKSISIVRMGDGEGGILSALKDKPFNKFEPRHPGWNKRMGIEGIATDVLQAKIIDAGNSCTYFSPSISGVSIEKYFIYKFFKPRPYYFDNFFVNDWTKEMIEIILQESKGVFIIHRDYKKIIENFKKTYGKEIDFDGFTKNSIDDNDQAVEAAVKSGAQFILFSAGPAGKIIGPEIAKAKSKVVIDVGNTLINWSLGKPRG